MIFAGMDVHSKTTTICLFDPSAPEDKRYRFERIETSGFEFHRVLGPLGGQVRVAWEVGPQVQWIAGLVRPLAASIHVANASKVTWLYRDGRKNDRIDARKLATLLYLEQLPTVHLPPEEVSSWRALINYRRRLVQQRAAMKTRIRAMLRGSGLCYMKKNVWTRKGRAWLAELPLDGSQSLVMKMLLDDVQTKDGQILEVEKQLDLLAAGRPQVALIRTIPGIGPRTAEAIIAFTDEIGRFRDRKAFTSYFGLTPTEDSSAEVVRRGHISKRGPSVVRWVLGEATYRVLGLCPAFRPFFDQVYRGQPARKKIAMVATARKILSVIFGMLRHGKPFDPHRLTPQAA
ncbi:MAG: hypothetical protein AMXMBFR33_73830 [Candidatus Xenobia bacterium]